MRFFYYLFCFIVSSSMASDAVLRIATTSSTENSGLMTHLIPDFESQCDCKVRMLVSGSGQALALGMRGDVDALLTHAPAAEKQFMQSGFGSQRVQVMYNDFVLLGPQPATDSITMSNISSTHFQDNDSVKQWMHDFANTAKNTNIKFISRGDGSGTHQKEKSLWQLANINPTASDAWYIEAGAGMGQALLLADQLGAYTLSDRGTYLAFRDKINLHIAASGASALHNPYSAIIVNPQKHPHINHKLASQFLMWLTSKPVQEKIRNFRFNGEVLFHPFDSNSNS